jgi:hypothetical protein
MSTAQVLNFHFCLILLHPIGLTSLLMDILVSYLYTFCSYEKTAECLSFDTKKYQRPWTFFIHFNRSLALLIHPQT